MTCPTLRESVRSSSLCFDTTNSASASGNVTTYVGLFTSFAPSATVESLVSTSVLRISLAASLCPYFTALLYDEGWKRTSSCPITCVRS